MTRIPDRICSRLPKRLPDELKFSNYALSFNGTNYVDCGNAIAIISAISLGMWINPTINNSWNQDSVITKMLAVAPYLVWKIGLTNTGKVVLDVRANSVNQQSVTSATISTGVYSFIVGTFDGRYMKIYINGVLDAGSVVDLGGVYPIDDAVADTYIGYDLANDRYFKGIIDEPQVLPLALSSDIILSIYYRGCAQRELGARIVLRLEENGGLVANDESGYGNNGSLLPALTPPVWVPISKHELLSETNV